MTTCWECEIDTLQPRIATLRLASGASRSYPLCAACFAAHYLPLLEDEVANVDLKHAISPQDARPWLPGTMS